MWAIPESDCKAFLLKISSDIRLLIIISLSSYDHHHQLIIISSSFHHFIISSFHHFIISSFHHFIISSFHHHHHRHHHHHHLIIIIISPSSSSSFPSLSLAFLVFSILAEPNSHEKRARCDPSQEKCVFQSKKCQKLNVFGVFGVPKVLWIVLTTCYIRPFFQESKNERKCEKKRQKLRVFGDFFVFEATSAGIRLSSGKN